MALRWILPLTTLLMACGPGSDKGPSAPDGGDTSDDVASDGPSSDDGAASSSDTGDDDDGAASKGPIPTECTKVDHDLCVPPRKYIKKLCAGDYPNVALYMFQSGMPWTRGWLSHETKAVNASGGGSTGDKMPPDEELIVLRKFEGQSPGGIQVSGNNGGFDAMRWDGTCVTLDASELYFGDAPNRVKNARIIWARIEYDIREKLKEDNDTIRKTFIEYKGACKGVTVGKVSAECEKLDGVLSRTLAEELRVNGGFPVPTKLP
jgi:hypothetical protein